MTQLDLQLPDDRLTFHVRAADGRLLQSIEAASAGEWREAVAWGWLAIRNDLDRLQAVEAHTCRKETIVWA